MSDTTQLPLLPAGSRATLSAVNEPRRALQGHLVPRSEDGIPTGSAGDLGTPSVPWRDVNISGAFRRNGRPIGLPGETARGGIVSIGSIPPLVPDGNNIVFNANGGAGEVVTLLLPDGETTVEITNSASIGVGTFNETTNRRANIHGQNDFENPDDRRGIEFRGLPGIVNSTRTVFPAQPGTADALAVDFTSAGAGGNNSARGLRLRNQGSEIVAESQLARLVALKLKGATTATDEVVIMQLFDVNNAIRGQRASSMIVGRGNTFGRGRAFPNDAQVFLMRLLFVYAEPDGAGGVTLTASPQPATDWSDPSNIPNDTLIWHRARDGATLRRAGGAPGGAFSEVNAVFVGAVAVGQRGAEAILGVPLVGHVDLALASPFAVAPFETLEFHPAPQTLPLRTISHEGSPCLPCKMRGIHARATSVSTTINAPPSSEAGRTFFIYANLGDAGVAETLISNLSPIPVEGGGRMAYLYPDQRRAAICVGAFER